MTPELMERAIAAGQDCGSLTDAEAVALYEECCALLRRGWSVRVLDAWADAHAQALHVPGDKAPKYYASPVGDAARHAAALAVFPSLPADVRAELKECP